MQLWPFPRCMAASSTAGFIPFFARSARHIQTTIWIRRYDFTVTVSASASTDANLHCQGGNLLSYRLLCLFESANDQQNQQKFSRSYAAVTRVLFGRLGTYAVVARVLFKVAKPMPL